MRISIARQVFPFLMVFITAVLICGCIWEEDRFVKIDYYVINTRADEILVKEKDATNGIVGFFLGPGENYHFAYHGNKSFLSINSGPSTIRIAFDFYASGDDESFTEYIGCYEFNPELDDNYACVETCFVR